MRIFDVAWSTKSFVYGEYMRSGRVRAIIDLNERQLARIVKNTKCIFSGSPLRSLVSISYGNRRCYKVSLLAPWLGNQSRTWANHFSNNILQDWTYIVIRCFKVPVVLDSLLFLVEFQITSGHGFHMACFVSVSSPKHVITWWGLRCTASLSFALIHWLHIVQQRWYIPEVQCTVSLGSSYPDKFTKKSGKFGRIVWSLYSP